MLLPLSQRLERRGRGAGISSSSAGATTSSAGAVFTARPPWAVMIGRLLQCASPSSAMRFLSRGGKGGVTRVQRRRLAEVAGLERAWAQCNQSIRANLEDLNSMLVDELFTPFHFYRQSLTDGTPEVQPRDLFRSRRATPPLANKSWPWNKTGKKSKKRGRSVDSGFWQVSNGLKQHPWLPAGSIESTFDCVVHFVQSGSGTGVHIGHGVVLTCAHVIDSRDDEADAMPNRLGREKVVVFPSKRLSWRNVCAWSLRTARKMSLSCRFRMKSVAEGNHDAPRHPLSRHLLWSLDPDFSA